MKLIKKIMLTTLVIILVLFVAVYAFIQQPEFGRAPSGARLELIKKSPHYRDGSFQNLSVTPDLTEGVSYFSVMKDFIFSEKLRNKPTDTIPSVKTDLKHLDPQQDVIIWFGHSSYFMQIDGKKFLVDPVLSGAASPVAFTTRSFIGTDVYTPDDFPAIDYLLISHDHWDHLDYKTILALKSKVGKVITGLGTGEHFEYWGFDKNMVIEKDWNEQIELGEGFTIYTAPARHFSGRTFARNRAIWTSFILVAPHYKLYIGGDSGYDTHFAEIGKKFGGFDLAILENGQYDKSWKYIHMLPDEVLKAAKDLNAKRLFPVHSSKFALGNHSWDEPLRKITELNQSSGIPLITPVIGQPVLLKDSTQTFKKWWEGLN